MHVKKKSGPVRKPRWLWIALAIVLAFAVAVIGWFLSRFVFDQSYRQYLKVPVGASERTAFTPLDEPESSVGEGFVLCAENDMLKLYANAETGCVAVYDKRNGQTVYSNPPAADQDTIANKKNKNVLKSQFLIDYYNASITAATYDSYSMSTELGNMYVYSIEDGVCFVYEVGEDAVKNLTPSLIPAERYEELYASFTKQEQSAADKVYEKQENGYVLTELGASRTRDLQRISQAFEKLGMTKAEYLELERLAGKELPEVLGFTVVLEWRLKGDAVECTVPVSAVQERGGGKIYRIQLLPYMAAADDEETGYLVVPNGSGSLIHFNNGKNTVASYSQYVYEMDLMDSDYTETQNVQPVRLPLFGICRENSSVLATIEKGASFASINADVAGRSNSYNCAYPVFKLRGSERLSVFGAGEMSEMPVVEQNIYGEDLTVRYTFLTDEKSGYSGLASAYRERLIAEGVLTPKAQGGDIPFYYDVIGGVKETAHVLGVQYLRVLPMTTFEEAGEMAEELNAAGVSNQVMNLQGWMNGGYYHDVTDQVKVLGELGGEKALNELNRKLSSLEGELFADAAFQHVTYISKRYQKTQETSRYYGAGYISVFGMNRPQTLQKVDALGYPERLYALLSPKYLPRYVNGFLKATEKLELSGISLRDLGAYLHADKRRSELINREQALSIVESQLDAIRESGRSVMVSGGNLYALQGVTHVLNAPTQATEYYIVDEEIPLYQMILHGCVDYAGVAINTVISEDVQKDRLRMIEYGAAPHYTFTAQDAADMKNTGLNHLFATTFSAWKDEAAYTYEYVNGALRSVSAAQMVEHAALSDTLRRIRYDNGVTIYVNYGAEDAQADGLVIPARGYLTQEGGQVK